MVSEAGRVLPPAATMMAYAIDEAARGNVDLARVWLDIARELREGSRPALASGGIVGPLGDFRLAPGETLVDRTGAPISASAPPATTRSDLAGEATTSLAEHASRLRPGIAETVVIKRPEWNVGDRALCEHCDEQIYVYAEPLNVGRLTTGEPQYGLKQWRHVLTEQVVCPLPPRDSTGQESYVNGSHTFAEPHIPG